MNAQVGYLVGLAIEYLQNGDLDDALRLLKQADKMAPKTSEILRLLGVLYAFKKDLSEALHFFDMSLKADPRNFLAHSNRGNVLKDLRKFSEALASFEKAVAIEPAYAEAFNNKGNLLQDLKRFPEALECYKKAISLEPLYGEAYGNVGNVLQNLNMLDQAFESYEKAMQLGAEKSINLGSLIHCKMKLCNWEGIYEQCEKVINFDLSKTVRIHPFNLLSFLEDPFLLNEYTTRYVRSEYPLKANQYSRRAERASGKIKIGYFSPDFCSHAISYLIAGMIEEHDREKFQIFAFSLRGENSDEMRSRLEFAFDEFIDVSLIGDEDVAKLARGFGIDVAIDLAGLTQDARPGIFSYRAAEIQIGYLGYLGTMATSFMDYIIADKIIIPAELRDAYSEKIIYLNSYQPNDPKRQISDRVFIRDELGLPKEGFVFCCFNNNYKFTQSIFNSWSRILSEVSGSVLLLYAENDTVRLNLRNEIQARGIDAARLIFGARLPREDYLARYQVADLFLDTSPYNAGTTASDALWAGLPVLTFLGRTFSSRMCASLLNAIGLPELVASSLREYEDLAISIAKDPDRISGLKKKLAENRLTKPLFNTKLFTRNLELAYTKAHERAELGLAPDHIYLQYE